MVKLVDRLKEHYKHVSLYRMTVSELETLRKKKIETKWIESFNTIIAVVVGWVFFFYEYQHMGIIIIMTGIFLGISSLFTDNHINQIDQAMFLLESTEVK